MSRESNDLDIIIYSPTDNQKKILNQFAIFDLIKDRPCSYTSNNCKAIKLSREGLFMDIIVENSIIPTNLLYYRYGCSDIMYKVQNIYNIIEAKNSYKIKSNENPLIKYIRGKDLEDFIDLKNSNFNCK